MQQNMWRRRCSPPSPSGWISDAMCLVVCWWCPLSSVYPLSLPRRKPKQASCELPPRLIIVAESEKGEEEQVRESFVRKTLTSKEVVALFTDRMVVIGRWFAGWEQNFRKAVIDRGSVPRSQYLLYDLSGFCCQKLGAPAGLHNSCHLLLCDKSRFLFYEVAAGQERGRQEGRRGGARARGKNVFITHTKVIRPGYPFYPSF